MNLRCQILLLACFCLVLVSTGCREVARNSGRELDVGRPEQVVSFAVLYGQNCAGCHGPNGRNGAAISLNNPVYLATAGSANIRRITAEGVAGTMMPPFGKQAGGMLTSQQIEILTQGMIKAWGQPDAAPASAPDYQSSLQGDTLQGQKSFATFCARCHQADSLIDPAYLALASDQRLRSTIIAGEPGRGMPDWRFDGPRSMTDQEVSDTVAWLASHRIAAPGQPYQEPTVSKAR